MKIGTGTVEHAALPVLLEGDFDAMSAQMVERSVIFLMRNGEGVVDTAMVVGHGIDRRIALHQDETGASCVEEDHLPVRRGGQVPAADNSRVKPRALRDVADGNAEMGNGIDRNHPTSLVLTPHH